MRLTRQTSDWDDDAQLLEACLGGDERAWSALVERYSRLIYSIGLRSGLTEDAADLVQNVFTIVLRRLETLQQADRFSAWLITTSHREAWRLRRMRRDDPLPEGFDPIDTDDAADVQVAAWEQAMLTRQALQELGGQCQRLLELLFLDYDQPDYKSVSAELGIAVGSIGPIRARCLKRLKGILAKRGVVEG